MPAFTQVTRANMYTLDVWNELRLAWSERKQAIGEAALDPEQSAGGHEHDCYDVPEMQAWIKANCTSFVDHDATFDGVTDEDFPAYTWETFCEKAGLDYAALPANYDWRGQTDEDEAELGNFDYRQMVEPDIIGWWIVEDLQKAFSALRYSRLSGSILSGKFRWGRGEESSYADSQDAAQEAYDTGDPSTMTGLTFRAYSWAVPDIPLAEIERYDDHKYKLFDGTRLDADVDLYMRAIMYTDNNYFGSDATYSFHAHGTGLQENTWTRMIADHAITTAEEDPEVTFTSPAGIGVGSYPTWPVSPSGNVVYNFWVQGASRRKFILKWDFTKTTMPG